MHKCAPEITWYTGVIPLVLKYRSSIKTLWNCKERVVDLLVVLPPVVWVGYIKYVSKIISLPHSLLLVSLLEGLVFIVCMLVSPNSLVINNYSAFCCVVVNFENS